MSLIWEYVRYELVLFSYPNPNPRFTPRSYTSTLLIFKTWTARLGFVRELKSLRPPRSTFDVILSRDLVSLVCKK